MAKFKKLPVIIEAFKMGIDPIPDWFMDKVTDKKITLKSDKPENHSDPFDHSYKTWCIIETLEGMMVGDYGDMIIKGVNGECYPCKPDIFEKTYEEAE
jgi:hypothetical protein